MEPDGSTLRLGLHGLAGAGVQRVWAVNRPPLERMLGPQTIVRLLMMGVRRFFHGMPGSDIVHSDIAFAVDVDFLEVLGNRGIPALGFLKRKMTIVRGIRFGEFLLPFRVPMLRVRL